jgi:hypothetical protein
MKRYHKTAEFKNKEIAFAEETLNLAAQRHYGTDKTILGGGRNKTSNCTWHGGCFVGGQ